MFNKQVGLPYLLELAALGLILATGSTVMIHQPIILVVLFGFICATVGLHISAKKGWDLAISHILLVLILIFMPFLVHETPLATRGEVNVGATGFGMATAKSMPVRIQGQSYMVTYKFNQYPTSMYWFNVYQRSGWFYHRITSEPYTVRLDDNVGDHWVSDDDDDPLSWSPKKVFKTYIKQKHIDIQPYGAKPRRAEGTSADRYIIRIGGHYFVHQDGGPNGNELLYRPPMSPEADNAGKTMPEQLRVTGITRFAWSHDMIVGTVQQDGHAFYVQHGEEIPFGRNRYFAFQFSTGDIFASKTIDPDWGIKADQLKIPAEYQWDNRFIYASKQGPDTYGDRPPDSVPERDQFEHSKNHYGRFFD